MKKSEIIMTTVAVYFCAAVLVAVTVTAPTLAKLFVDFRGLDTSVGNAILIAYYICSVPAFASLVCLWKILDNIRREEPFLSQNAALMSVVSYCCVAVSAVTAWCGFHYMPMWFISAAMLFVFLIVRVVRRCFIAAIYLKEENSLTI